MVGTAQMAVKIKTAISMSFNYTKEENEMKKTNRPTTQLTNKPSDAATVVCLGRLGALCKALKRHLEEF